MRAESVQSFANAQSIIQWSLATYGVLFAGALVLLTQSVEPANSSFRDVAILLIFTVLLPGLICAATWQWLGEITRMERVGMYLRGLERHLNNNANYNPRLVINDAPSLHWETFLNSEGRARKRNAPYVGTAAMFAGALLVSLSLAGVWQSRLFGGEWWSFPTVLWPATGILLGVIFFVVSLLLGRSVVVMGNERYNFTTRRVEKIDKSGSSR